MENGKDTRKNVFLPIFVMNWTTKWYEKDVMKTCLDGLWGTTFQFHSTFYYNILFLTKLLVKNVSIFFSDFLLTLHFRESLNWLNGTHLLLSFFFFFSIINSHFWDVYDIQPRYYNQLFLCYLLFRGKCLFIVIEQVNIFCTKTYFSCNLCSSYIVFYYQYSNTFKV